MLVSARARGSLESQAQICAQAQRQLASVCLADGVPIRVVDVPPRPPVASIVKGGFAIDLEVDEAVQAAEDAKQDVLGRLVARGADIAAARGRRRDARVRSAARLAPRATRWACPTSSPRSWSRAGSDARQEPSGPPAPRESGPRGGRESPRRRSGRPSAAATATRRSRPALRARRPRSRTAGHSRRSAGTGFRREGCRGPGRHRSAPPAPLGEGTSPTRADGRPSCQTGECAGSSCDHGRHS